MGEDKYIISENYNKEIKDKKGLLVCTNSIPDKNDSDVI